MQTLSYLNGQFLPFANAALPLNDAGFLNGATVTDNCRTWHGRLFRWDDHLQRFRRDCNACFVPLTKNNEEITAIAHELLKPVSDDMHLITFATPTSFGMFLREVDHARNQRFRTEGVHLRVVGHQPVSRSAVLPPTWKHRSRMLWHIASHRAGDAVAILTDLPGGTLTETGIGNILGIRNRTLLTPPREQLLDGITLRVVLELAATMNLNVIDAPIETCELANLDAMILVGTGFGVAPVRAVDSHLYSTDHPVVYSLITAWDDAVRNTGCAAGQ